MNLARKEIRLRPGDEKYLEIVANALALLRSGREFTRFELFPNASAELRTFQKNVLKALVERTVVTRIEGGDPQSPTVKFVVRSRHALENLAENDEALAKIVDSAWPVSAVSDKPPSLEVVKRFMEEPPKPEPKKEEPLPPPIPHSLPAPADGLKEAVEQLSKIVNAEGQSILYIRERLDELCRYLGQVLPPMEEKVNELHKEWKGVK